MLLRAVVLAACAFGGAVAAGAQERELAVVAPFEITSLDPSKAGYVFTRMEVAETLLEADEGGRPLPGLAESWSLSDDRLTWRFDLRPDVRFHDGTAMTAETVAESLRIARGKPGPLGQAPVEEIAAEEGSVVLRLASPFAPLSAVLAHTSTQILAPAAYDTEGEVREVIGTGPYRTTVVEAPQRLRVERYEDYWGEAPAIGRASYLAASRGETRALLAESGDAQLVFTLDPASYARLGRSERLEVRSVAIPRTVTMKVNAGHPFLDDPRARRALSFALDREGIAAAILRHPEAAASQLFPPSLGDWHDAALPPLAQNLETARAMLAELGWTPGEDGLLRREGEVFRLTLRTFPDRPELPLLAAAVQDQLRELGIELQVSVGNSSEIPAGHQDGTLELGLLARNFGLIPDPLGTLLQDFGARGDDWGAMNWNNGRMPALLEALLGAGDPEELAALRREAAALLQAELPVVPVAWYQHTAAVSHALEGVEIDPLERSFRLSRMRWAQ